MSEHTDATGKTVSDAAQRAFEMASRRVFQDSVEGLDMRLQSRLTQARHAALQAAADAAHRPWLFHWRVWKPAVGVTAAVLLGAALWLALPGMHGSAADQPSLEDLDMVASTDEASGDAIEMLQNDLDFYDFADKAATAEPAA